MQQLTTYNFNNFEIRGTKDADGRPILVAADIAKALDYRDSTDMVRMLDEDEIHDKHIVRVTTSNQHNSFEKDVEMTMITESGMYHAIFNSRKEEAKAFRKWVTSEVLPSIRKTGTYTMTRAEFKALREDVIAGPKTLRLEKEIATLKLKQTKAEAKPEIARLKQKVERLEARVEHLFKGGCKVKAQFDNLCKGRMAYLDFNYLTEDGFGNPLPMIF